MMKKLGKKTLGFLEDCFDAQTAKELEVICEKEGMTTEEVIKKRGSTSW